MTVICMITRASALSGENESTCSEDGVEARVSACTIAKTNVCFEAS